MAQQESMREMLEKPISQLQALSQSLFSAMSSGQLPEPPTAALAACDTSLAEAMRLVRIHLLKQKQIEQLMDEVCELDSQLVEVVDSLSKGQRELQAIIDEGEERIASAEKATSRAVPYSSIISYGSKLADFTSAPPNAPMDDREPAGLPYAFHPPFPATEIMQRGRLGSQEPIGPVGETGVVGSTKAIPFDATAPTQTTARATQLPQQTRRAAIPAMDIFDLDLNPELA